jgi:hypothetical protein
MTNYPSTYAHEGAPKSAVLSPGRSGPPPSPPSGNVSGSNLTNSGTAVAAPASSTSKLPTSPHGGSVSGGSLTSSVAATNNAAFATSSTSFTSVPGRFSFFSSALRSLCLSDLVCFSNGNVRSSAPNNNAAATKAVTTNPVLDGYDGQLHQLRVAFHAMVRDLLEDASRAVKRRVLVSLSALCRFFGRRISSETFVPFMITFLSHTDWQLRATAYQHLYGMMTVVGSKALEDITVALIGKSFGDPSEHVVVQSLHCCCSLVDAKLLRATVVFDICMQAVPLLLHSNPFVRQAALLLVVNCWERSAVGDRFVFISSAMDPFLLFSVLPHQPAESLRGAVRPSVARSDLKVDCPLSPLHFPVK